MPLIQVKSSVAAPEKAAVDSLLKNLSANLAKHLSKPESYVMTAFESDVPMTMGGTFEPVCYVEVKSIGNMSNSQTKTISQDFCQLLHDKLGVPTNRIYIEFADAKGYMWGWDSRTFG
jgi:phenylpyruvate tautomerase PptA (4-oxalocrotonate tautomerase family)